MRLAVSKFLAGFAAVGLCWVSPAFATDRLTDKDVKALVARIEQGRDRFDDAMDGKLKRSIVRGPSGEMNVSDFLNDFQESIDRVEERLQPGYAASAEVGTLLQQASRIRRLFREQPPGTKGESEWNRLETDLKALAAAYGTDFPPGENASVRRIGDRELAAAVEEIGRVGDRLEKSLDSELKKDPSIGQPARQAMVAEADGLEKDAKALRSRIKNADPSSAEAERLLARARKVQAIFDSHQLPASSGTWSTATSQLQSVASAYGVPWR